MELVDYGRGSKPSRTLSIEMLCRRLHLPFGWRRLAARSYASEGISKGAGLLGKRPPQRVHKSSLGAFVQTPPQLYNTFVEDGYLRHCLEQKLPSDVTF